MAKSKKPAKNPKESSRPFAKKPARPGKQMTAKQLREAEKEKGRKEVERLNRGGKKRPSATPATTAKSNSVVGQKRPKPMESLLTNSTTPPLSPAAVVAPPAAPPEKLENEDCTKCGSPLHFNGNGYFCPDCDVPKTPEVFLACDHCGAKFIDGGPGSVTAGDACPNCEDHNEQGELRLVESPADPPRPAPGAGPIPPGANATPAAAPEEGEQRHHFPEPEKIGGSSAASPRTDRLGSALARQQAAAAPIPNGKVAGYVPTEEQAAILEVTHQSGLKVLVIGAGAGTGKTSQLKMLEQVLPGRGQYTAYNRSLVDESKSKFVKANCATQHGLAFRAVGRKFAHRLNSERVRSDEIARRLGIAAITVETGAVKDDGKPVVKVLQAGFLAGQTIRAVQSFCQSADSEINVKHFRYIDGIDLPSEDGKKGWANNREVHATLLPYAEKAWADLSNPEGTLPFVHDYYVKVWALGQGPDRPHIAADYILLDEAQDTSGVMLGVLEQQTHALLVLVGDDNQSIYEWRGAINAMKAFPDAPRRLLSQSFRFGQAIADVANTVLATLDEPTDLVLKGLPAIPSRVAPLANPRCVLCRTNAAAVGNVLAAMREGKRPHLIGGGADVVRFVRAARDLQAGKRTDHPELCCFESWKEVEEYAKTDEGADLALMCRLIKEFGCQPILDALEKMPEERDADLVVSTAHKSKGREWPTVKLAADFPTADKMSDADRRLLYVAATRAQEQLDISECPPFAGAESKPYKDEDTEEWVEGEWVPGLNVAYTAAQPSVEQLETYRAGKEIEQQKAAEVKEQNAPPSQPTLPTAEGNFSWSNYQGAWCVRGPKGNEGKIVKVTRRNGSWDDELLKAVIRDFGDACLYRVGS